MSESLRDRPSAKEVFTAALKLDAPAQRQAYLDLACGRDAALRAQVAELLAAVQPAARDNPLDAMVEVFRPALTGNSATVLEVPGEVSPPREIGPYKLLEQIGEGGFGTVYMAEQSVPLRRKVAIKILKPGMGSKEILARFEAERQALAMMDHPNIARVLDAGSTAEGLPYFVMELVRGVPVTEYCDEARLTTDERLALFVDICRAVQHAHQKGIIHRDLKPSNVLVTMHDDKAVPKVIDFGIAKALSQQLTDRTLFTGFQQMLGTPLYMSPEQAQMSGIDVDTRSDVYSLGVLLYELLTGTTPFDRESLQNASYDDLRKIIREQEPPRPSHRLTTLDAAARATAADRRQVDQRKISDELRGELDWIVMKALEKDRNRRYESATALADDVQRYRSGEPVQACPPTLGYRLTKFTQRRRGLIVTAAALMVMLVSCTVVSFAFGMRADRARQSAQSAEQAATMALGEAEAAEAKAIAAKAQAEQNLEAALEAMDKLLTHASSRELIHIPRLQLTHRKILEDALQFHDRFQVTLGASPTLRFRAALAHKTLARMADLLSEWELCLQQSRSALSAFQQLVDDFPNEAEYRKELADAYYTVGFQLQFHHSNDNLPEAVQCHRRAIEEIDRLSAFAPDTAPRNAYQKARYLIRLSDCLKQLGVAEESRERIEEAYRLVVKADPQLNESRTSHSVFTEYAKLLQEMDPDRAIDVQLEGVRRSRQGMQTVGGYSATSNHCSSLISSFDLIRKRYPDLALSHAVEATEIGVKLTDDYPLRQIHRDYLKRSLKQLVALVSAGQSAETVDIVLTDLQNQHPNLADLHASRSAVRYRLENYDAALVDLQRAASIGPDDISTLTWIPPAEIMACPHESFRAGYLALVDDVPSDLPDSLQSQEEHLALLASLGRYEQALAGLQTLCDRGAATNRMRYLMALVASRQDEFAIYASICREMLQRSASSTDPGEVHWAVWASGLAPGALDDYGPATNAAQQAVEADMKNQQSLVNLGAIQLRADRIDEARQTLTHALEVPAHANTSTAYIRYFLALTQAHLGDDAQARQQLQLANELAEAELASSPAWNRRLTLELLRDEAAAMVGGNEAEAEIQRDVRPPAPPVPTRFTGIGR